VALSLTVGGGWVGTRGVVSLEGGWYYRVVGWYGGGLSGGDGCRVCCGGDGGDAWGGEVGGIGGRGAWGGLWMGVGR